MTSEAQPERVKQNERGLARRLFTLCPAVSLALCVAVCALWVRSHRVPEAFHRVTWLDPEGLHARAWIVTTSGGALGFEATESQRPPDPRWGPRKAPGFHYVARAAHPLARAGGSSQRLGFGWDRTVTRDPFARVARRRYVVPYWFLATATAVVPLRRLAPWLRRGRAAARHRRGLCPVCGYDRRASPARCPECGATAMPVEVTA